MMGIKFQDLTAKTSLYHLNPAKPFYLSSNILAVCFGGKADLEINNEECSFEAMNVAVLLTGTELKINKISSDYYGYIIELTDSVFTRISLLKQSTQYRYLINNPIASLSFDSYNLILSFKSIFEMLSQRDSECSVIQQMILNLLSSFELEISRSYYQKGEKSSSDKNDLIFRDFMVLLKKNHINRKGVEYYASYYTMSRRMFSRIIKEVSGKTPKEIINLELIKTAKDLLLNSDLSVSEIADKLSFAHQSAFGCFFKKETGHTPNDFRTRVKNDYIGLVS